MAFSSEESMVLYHIRSQKARITQNGTPSTTMGTPLFRAVESIHLPNCTPGLCAVTRARSWG